jgi:hypothetical protein
MQKFGERWCVPALILKSFAALLNIGLRTGVTTWDKCDVMRDVCVQAKSRSVTFAPDFVLLSQTKNRASSVEYLSICGHVRTLIESISYRSNDKADCDLMTKGLYSASQVVTRGSPGYQALTSSEAIITSTPSPSLRRIFWPASSDRKLTIQIFP